MRIHKGTTCIVVLSLIPLIISSTLSPRCFAGLKGGSFLVCAQKSLKVITLYLFFLLYLLWSDDNIEYEFCVCKLLNLFLSFSVRCLDAIKFWFWVSVNIKIPQSAFQHLNSCLNPCEKKTNVVPFIMEWLCSLNFFRGLSKTYKNYINI